jgi:hypothetical protein
MGFIHGLRTPNEAFSHRNPKQFGQINFEVFSSNVLASILVQFYPKSQIFIWDSNLNLGRKELEISHCVFIVRGFIHYTSAGSSSGG